MWCVWCGVWDGGVCKGHNSGPVNVLAVNYEDEVVGEEEGWLDVVVGVGCVGGVCVVRWDGIEGCARGTTPDLSTCWSSTMRKMR